MAGAAVDLRIAGAGGVRLAVRTTNVDAPDRTPILLVHGLASNARLWDGVAALLAGRGYPVAAVDQRGHGRSEKPDDGYDFATLTADLLAVVDGLGWSGRPVVAAGQSWGGNVVVELAARHPEAVAALVLVDGGTIDLSAGFADWPTCEAALTPPPFAGVRLADFETMVRRHHPDWPEAGIEGTLANVEVLADGTVRPWLTLPRHLTILRGLWEHHPRSRFETMAVPVVIAAAGRPEGAGRTPRSATAKRDGVAAASAALRANGVPCAVRWIDGDHDVHAQHPALVADLVAGAAEGAMFGATH
ncbi:MAG: alpha/beta fold hydrolase [Acidimicrobiales bacterium]